MHFETLSVEHILPQNPSDSSLWVKDFSPEDRATWTDRLGNLVLITRRKNASQGCLDYAEKNAKYFEKNHALWVRLSMLAQQESAPAPISSAAFPTI